MTYNPAIIELGGRRFSARANESFAAPTDTPLIVALHGGSYTSAYFDVAGYSLLGRADRLGIPAIALDRPSYGESDSADEHSHAAHAAILEAAISELSPGSGVVLVGHSIGGAIAIGIAAKQPDWLTGVAVSGVGLENMPGDLEAWQSMPDLPFLSMPSEFKDAKMFGPPGTYDAGAPDASHVADAPTPRQELIDIVTAWPRDVEALLGKVAVPLHYRQADGDALWQVSAAEVARFGNAACAAPWHDAALVRGAGHCIDFHKMGAAFQLEQLAFALKCGVEIGA